MSEADKLDGIGLALGKRSGSISLVKVHLEGENAGAVVSQRDFETEFWNLFMTLSALNGGTMMLRADKRVFTITVKEETVQ